MKTTIFIFIIAFLQCFFTIPQKALCQNNQSINITGAVPGSSEAMWISDILFKNNTNKQFTTETYFYENIEGNPFMFEDFKNGVVKLRDGRTFNGKFQFDKFANEIHFLKDENIYAIAYPNKIEYIEIDNTRFIYSHYKISESEITFFEGNYFIDLSDESCKLLAKKNCFIEEAKESNGLTDKKPKQFADKNDSYYIKISDQTPAIKITNKRSIFSIFDSKRFEIQDFIKKEKLSTKKVDDLKKLVSYYNELIEKN